MQRQWLLASTLKVGHHQLTSTVRLIIYPATYNTEISRVTVRPWKLPVRKGSNSMAEAVVGRCFFYKVYVDSEFFFSFSFNI